MSSATIKHPLRVFISSKCGGKYSVARKALETLLKSTGLVEVYVFENEPASSEDTQSAYLEYVDQSNLCIFLVDMRQFFFFEKELTCIPRIIIIHQVLFRRTRTYSMIITGIAGNIPVDSTTEIFAIIS